MVLKRPLQIFNGFWGDHHHWMFFGRSDHCHQWFYDVFLMLLPLLSMVFDGSLPLVKRCDGFDGSLWSTALWLPSSRIDLVDFELDGGSAIDKPCDRDSVTVRTPSFAPCSLIYFEVMGTGGLSLGIGPLCGENSGQHLYLPVQGAR